MDTCIYHVGYPFVNILIDSCVTAVCPYGRLCLSVELSVCRVVCMSVCVSHH